MISHKALCGEFRGAKTPEQRSSVVSSADLANQPVQVTEKESNNMKTKNNTEAPRLHVNWKHLFLVALHLVVFVFSALSDGFTTAKGAAGALP